jgi:hypothetical protein
VSTQAASDAAIENAQTIIDLMVQYGTERTTPLFMALENYTDATHAPIFFNPDARRFLIVVSDGMDSCGNDTGRNITNQQLSDLTTQIVDEQGLGVFVIGFGSGADPDQLNAIASVGNTEFTEYLDAQDAASLEEALNTVAESVVGCVFELGDYDPDVVDTNTVNFYFDGVGIPQDPDCAQNMGWTWLDDARTQVEFCEDACEWLRSGDVDTISAEAGCTPLIVT